MTEAGKKAKRVRAVVYYAKNREKLLAQATAYYAANREKIAAQRAAYRAANKEKCAAQRAVRDVAYRAANKDKRAASGAAYRAANKAKITTYTAATKDKANDRRLKRTYGLSSAKKEGMLRQQSGACALCGTKAPGKSGWHIDHNHTTGKVRGLLCLWCNVGLGYFKDRADLLRRAANYVGVHA